MPKQRANMVYAGFAARQLPKIKITKEQADKIRGVVNGALIKRGKPKLGNSLADLLDHDPVTVVKQAVEHLVSEKVYSVPVAEFRAMVRKRRPSDLRKTLERLAKLLPETDAFPPWWQMRAAFTGGDPFAADLGHDGDCDKEDEWKSKYAPDILQAALRQHLDLMDKLDELAGGFRPVEVPERQFVSALARYWKETLGLKVSESRSNDTPSGEFRDFVKAAAALYPKVEDLVDDSRKKHVRLRALTTFIREAAEGN